MKRSPEKQLSKEDLSEEKHPHSERSEKFGVRSLLVSQQTADSPKTTPRSTGDGATGDHQLPSVDEMIDTSVKNSKRVFEERMKMLNRAFQTESRRKEEEHEQQLTAIEEVHKLELATVSSQLEEAEKVNTLFTVLFRNKSPISERSADLMQLGVEERHRKVEGYYRRFQNYSELLGRTDLGVLATTDDLQEVHSFVDNTIVPPPPVYSPPQLRGLRGLCARGDYDNVIWPQLQAAHNQEVARASSVPFPSEAFDRLADEVNKIISIAKCLANES